MANWITHTVICDKVVEKLPFLDERGFCIGNIAPDCNVENSDWTAFEPPREVTHFMSGSSKLTADYEKFFDLYIRGEEFLSKEHRSFLLGYYSHLVTDLMWVKYLHNVDRVKKCFIRLKSEPGKRGRLLGLPEEYETIKSVFGRKCFLEDAVNIEHRYILENPHNSYNRVLRKITEFNDYLDFLPEGAIVRKIKIMSYEPPGEIEKVPLYFLTDEEYEAFISTTSELICRLLSEKCS